MAPAAPPRLPFFDRLSQHYALMVPEHPGFGGSDDPPGSAMWRPRDVLSRFPRSGLGAGPGDRPFAGRLDRGRACDAQLPRIASLTLLSPAGIRVKGVPSGDNFIWGPEEAVRNLYHDQAFAERMLAMVPPDEKQTRLALKNRFTAAKFGWQPRWFNPDLEKWLHRIKVPTHRRVGRRGQDLPARYAELWRKRVPGAPVVDDRACGHLSACRERPSWSPQGPRLPEGAQRNEIRLLPSDALSAARFRSGARHRSAWVVLPNSLYDPEKGAEEYAAIIDQLVYAEQLGFDAIGVNEHHQTAYGLMPAPNLIASALIQRTKKVKIAILGRALPLVNNPINIAEEFAMLDNLSKGRIIAGFVRGIGAEYHATGINPSFSHERFHEAHDLIISAWTSPARSSSRASTSTSATSICGRGPISSRIRRSGSPRWVPARRSVWASAPRRKYPFLVTFSPEEPWCAISTCIATRREVTATRPRAEQLGWAAPIYVAETDERASEEARAGIETLFNNYLRMPWEMLLPPGYTSKVAEGDHEAAHGAGLAAAQHDDRRSYRRAAPP